MPEIIQIAVAKIADPFRFGLVGETRRLDADRIGGDSRLDVLVSIVV
jgi:hypothetical protein